MSPPLPPENFNHTLCIYSLFQLNIKAGVFKEFRVVLLSRSLFNYLRTFANLIRSSFFEFGKILSHSRGIRASFFAPGQGIGQKNLPGWPGLARSKKFSPGVARGGGERCVQLELTET